MMIPTQAQKRKKLTSLLTKRKILHFQMPTLDALTNTEATRIKVSMTNDKYDYFQRKVTQPTDRQNSTSKYCCKHTIVIWNLNSKSYDWNTRTTNANGRVVHVLGDASLEVTVILPVTSTFYSADVNRRQNVSDSRNSNLPPEIHTVQTSLSYYNPVILLVGETDRIQLQYHPDPVM